jgi:XTP/dITP diphosphohydrolase
VIAVAEPEGETCTAEGICEGVVGYAPQGEFGFGYDPVFYMPQQGRTMAQLPPEEKNRISHRARAAQAIRPVLERLVGRDHVSGKG